MKYAVIVFPGSNCDHDAYVAASVQSGAEAEYVWHKDTKLPDHIDCVILPGGFSYGDYLRCGAIARFSPIMKEVIKFADNGGNVIGICNGFQVLTESGLLPGALLRNNSMHFICKDVNLLVCNDNTAFTNKLNNGDIVTIPVAHGEGNYFAEPNIISELEDENRVVFRYCEPDGKLSDASNPNGSINNIAGIINKGGNILGMMPHPERYSDKQLGCDDGIAIFNSINSFLNF